MMRILLLLSFYFFLSHSSFSQTILHYWNFNNVNTVEEQLAPSQSLIVGSAITHIPGGTSEIQITSNVNQGFEVENLNAQSGDESGAHLRFNNPIGGILELAIPTTGFRQIVIKYSTRRSGQGAGTQNIAYSIDGGLTYVPYTSVQPVDGDPSLQTIDFSSVPEVNDNSDFRIQISFEELPGGTGGNNRFDNLTIEGNPSGADLIPPTVAFEPNDGSTYVSVDVSPSLTFNEPVELATGENVSNEALDTILLFTESSIDGIEVPFAATYANNVVTITPQNNLLQGEQYFVTLRGGFIADTSGNTINDDLTIAFTTEPLQTQFNPGDLVPVAYRMNAEGAEDAVALLALTNILPGTRVQLTDAKYTDNAQPQCNGGITWTTPSTVIAAGTVVVIGNDEGIASLGEISGSTFGLSSNGDQVIVYTGTAEAPSYITALSSNAFTTEPHTVCNGSISKLPAPLTLGLNAISLATSSQNVNGNTVNAFYHGSQTGTNDELRNAILDPANWTGTEEGTVPQVWPDWNFPGPPSVSEVQVLNANKIQIIFTKDLDPASATNPDNFTGIEDISIVEVTENGAEVDTVVLNYGTSFEKDSTYTLLINNVTDAEGRAMAGEFEFTFTYATTLAFNERYISVSEDAGVVNIPLTLNFPSAGQVNVNYAVHPFSKTSNNDFDPVTTSFSFDGNSERDVLLTLTINDDSAEENDEYLVVQLTNENGLAIDGENFFTLYIRDNDRLAPVATEEIKLNFTGRYTVDNPEGAEGLAEIVAYDPVSNRLFTMSTALRQVDIVDFSDPSNPQNVAIVSTEEYGSGLTSIATSNGVVAVSVTGIESEQENGHILFMDINGNVLNQVEAGALPDMLTFTQDGRYLLAANEGSPNDSYTIDPEGGVTIVDMTNGAASLTQADVTTLLFTQFNSQEADLINAGVRKTKSTSTLSQDFEPEYITVGDESRSAWVILQENNALVTLDLNTLAFGEVLPLGTKDYSQPGNGLDLSDRNEFVHLSNWPLQGFYIPDAIDNYTVNGETYIVSANEGDEKEYGGLNERTTVGAVNLDELAFPNAAMLQENHNMGRFRITNLHGDTDGDGDYDELYCNGGRSFSIWNATTGDLVSDSGDDFELITRSWPTIDNIFNADNADNVFKSRSRAKGPEPEGIKVVPFNDKQFVFVTLERVGGVMVYEITDPTTPVFVDYINTRNTEELGGDLGPEGIIYVYHTNGNHYIITANEVSGTLAIFEVENVITSNDEIASGNEKVGVYPNPVSGDYLHFSMHTNFTAYTLEGKQVLQGNNVNGTDVSSLHQGLYIFKFANGDTQKVIIAE